MNQYIFTNGEVIEQIFTKNQMLDRLECKKEVKRVVKIEKERGINVTCKEYVRIWKDLLDITTDDGNEELYWITSSTSTNSPLETYFEDINNKLISMGHYCITNGKGFAGLISSSKLENLDYQ